MSEAIPQKLSKRTTGGTPGILSPQQEGAGAFAFEAFSYHFQTFWEQVPTSAWQRKLICTMTICEHGLLRISAVFLRSRNEIMLHLETKDAHIRPVSPILQSA